MRRYGFLGHGVDRRGLAPPVGVNLTQHEGWDPHARRRRSRDFTNRVAHRLFFINGDGAVHLWSELQHSPLPDSRGHHLCPHQPAELAAPSIVWFPYRYLVAAGADGAPA